MNLTLDDLSVRHINSGDLNWLYDCKIKYRQFLQRPFFGTIDTQKEWIKTLGSNNFGLMIERGNCAVGFYYIKNIDWINSHHEFTYWANPEVLGKGYGKLILKKGLEYSFDTLGIRKVYGEVLSNNPASIKVMKGCGFQEIGVRKNHCFNNGQSIDIIIMETFSK